MPSNPTNLKNRNLKAHMWHSGNLSNPDTLPDVYDNEGQIVTKDTRLLSNSSAVDIGDSPNSNTGDPLRLAFIKVNNFMEASFWTNEAIDSDITEAYKKLDSEERARKDTDSDLKSAIDSDINDLRLFKIQIDSKMDSEYTRVNSSLSALADKGIEIYGDSEAVNFIVSLNQGSNGLHIHGQTNQIQTSVSKRTGADSDIVVSIGLPHYVVVNKFKVKENAQFDSDVTINGSLFVNGTTTTINTKNLEVTDSFVVLNKGNDNSTSVNSGIVFQRDDSDAVKAGTTKNTVLLWDEAADEFVVGETNKTGVENVLRSDVSSQYLVSAKGRFVLYDSDSIARVFWVSNTNQFVVRNNNSTIFTAFDTDKVARFDSTTNDILSTGTLDLAKLFHHNVVLTKSNSGNFYIDNAVLTNCTVDCGTF